MRRQGLPKTRRSSSTGRSSDGRAIAAMLAADPLAVVPEPPDDQTVELPGEGDELGIDGGKNADMGVQGGYQGPSPLAGGNNVVEPNVSVTVAVTPQQPIPAAPLILPATPGYGSWGTES